MTTNDETLSNPHAGMTLFLVDGMSHIFRAFYAIRNLSNSQGMATNAIYGFTAMMRKLLKQYQPHYVAVAFDGREKTFRHEEFESYKANRPEMPDDLARQIPYVRKICDALRIQVLEKPRFEADDIIGTLARKAEHDQFQTVIVSNDKDMYQLVTNKVQVLHQAKEDVFFDPQKVESFFGVPPEKVVDVLGLMGDAVDNVPGAPGIGEKGARDLIARFGNLDNLLASSASVERKTYRESLQAHREQILQSRKLVTIDTNAPVTVEWEELRVRPPDLELLRPLLTELGFQSMLKEFESGSPVPLQAQAATALGAVNDIQQLEKAIGEIKTSEQVFCYLELDSQEPLLARESALALQPSSQGAKTPGGCLVQFGEKVHFASDALRAFWEDSAIAKVFHNSKTALIISRKCGLKIEGIRWDTMLMSYLVYPNRTNHNFDDIVFALLEKPAPTEIGARCIVLGELFSTLLSKLKELELEDVYRDIELPLVEVLAEMEWNGVRIDCSALDEMSQELDHQIRALAQKIYGLAGMEFNINSPKQLGEILFEKLNLPTPKKLKKSGQYSTSVEILEQLAAEYELPRLMLDYRQLAKLKSTYVDALPKLVNKKTGRVHTSFNQTVAATGRLSSSNPNLQNIPIRTDLGLKIRSAFVPDQGCKLLAADYSQIELRVLAHLSQDPVLMDSFGKGEDVHTRTAVEVFGIHPGMQTRDIRRRAKAINFGIIYGQTPFGLAKELGITHREAQQFIQRYFERYRGVKSYIDQTIEETRQTMITRTLFGRLRQITEINSRNPAMRNFAERTAVNSPIQGTAADLIKLAMISIHRSLKEMKSESRMILQVHDELVFEVPESEIVTVQNLVKEKMEQVYRLSVPLVVEIGVGENWMET